jgi:hypothetical protein
MKFRLAILLLIVIGLTPDASGGGIGLEGSWTIGNYEVTIKNTEDKNGLSTATLNVNLGGTSIYTIKNTALWLNPAGFFADPGKMSYESSMKPVRIGADILGLGKPTLVVWGFSLGAHCCSDLTILSLGDRFRAMPTIHLYDSEYVHFRPAPGHSALVISARDWTFAYWRAPFAFS